MRGPLPTIGSLPHRHLGGVERRDLNGSPGHDLRGRDGRLLRDMRLSECRSELQAMGFPVAAFPELGKNDLLAAASAHFGRVQKAYSDGYNPGIELIEAVTGKDSK